MDEERKFLILDKEFTEEISKDYLVFLSLIFSKWMKRFKVDDVTIISILVNRTVNTMMDLVGIQVTKEFIENAFALRESLEARRDNKLN